MIQNQYIRFPCVLVEEVCWRTDIYFTLREYWYKGKPFLWRSFGLDFGPTSSKVEEQGSYICEGDVTNQLVEGSTWEAGTNTISQYPHIFPYFPILSWGIKLLMIYSFLDSCVLFILMFPRECIFVLANDFLSKL